MRRTLLVLCAVSVFVWSERARAQTCDDLRLGLVSWWTGDEDADDHIGDHDGSLNGAEAGVEGMVDGAFRFDGVDDYIEVPSSPDFNLGMDDFTIDAWVNLSHVDPQEIYPVIMRGLCISADFSYADWLLFVFNGQIGFTRFDGAETTFAVSWTPLPNTWYHLAVVRSVDMLSFYVDGQQQGDAINIGSMDYGPGPVADMNVNIGREEGGELCVKKDRWWNGELDEIKLYNRALTALEIEALFHMRGECKDSDGDGVLNGDDSCPDSDLRSTIVLDDIDTGIENTLFEDGCTVTDMIDELLALDPNNSEVVHLLLDLAGEGAITRRELGELVSTILSMQ